MEPIQWTLSETFQFPAEYGKAVSADEVKVTAGYTEHHTEEAVRLSGIYHVAAKVVFDGEGLETVAETDAIAVDDVDVQGQSGYFEYAVPLLVDLPAVEGAELKANVTDASATATDDGGLLIMWTVEASETKVETPVATAAASPAAETAQVTAAEQSAEDQTATVTHDDDSSSLEYTATAAADVGDHEMLAFISDLEDDVTVTTFQLNDVFVE